ncbi:MAG: DEAD/DEAH box helicase [Elusimicrobiota bacterium]|jgi:superfamily II DNA or RNA helicase|nr:DEAD/DEAH box helicase [Elusimicrobiota bacterium]
MIDNKQDILNRLRILEEEKEKLVNQLKSLEIKSSQKHTDNKFTTQEKLNIFRSLFKGRQDVYARRFENNLTHKNGYYPVKNKDKFLPITDDIIKSHLQGYNENEFARYGYKKDFTIGIYPLLQDDTANFLVIDFDDDKYKEEIKRFSDICKNLTLPAYIEISRSGKGAHIWFFFLNPVSAGLARNLGTFLLSKTMEEYPHLSFSSYDRMFPAQDFLPKGGLGNLIALPLQNNPRKQGNSVFVNDNFIPFNDQWEFLSNVNKISVETLETILGQNKNSFENLFEDKANDTTALNENKVLFSNIVLPEYISAVLSNMIYIDISNIPPKLLNTIKKLAAFKNPEFYKFQAMRLPIYNKPRVICCAELEEKHLAIARGCLNQLKSLLNELKIELRLQDKRLSGNTIQAAFKGNLRKEQRILVEKILQNDICIMSAPTAFGKTVVAANVISKRKTNTLVLVHRKQLLEQWKERLNTFLKSKKIKIGVYYGAKKRLNNQIDIAMLQTLCRHKNIDEFLSPYGQIIIDECHHIAAFSFEQVVKCFKGRYALGISATTERKDGHQPIVSMQCGDIVSISKNQFSNNNISDKFVIYKNTDFTYLHDDIEINDIYEKIYKDDERNRLICGDIKKEYLKNKSCIVLTERKEHLFLLLEKLKEIKNIIILKGGMGKKQTEAIQSQLINMPKDEGIVLVSTGKYLGEGFDYDRLDRLFLAMPISWKGTLIQYAGRLHRKHKNKKDVLIYDYVDHKVPILYKMYLRRKRAYKLMKYAESSPQEKFIFT